MAVLGRSWDGVGGIFEDRPRPTPDVIVFVLVAALMALGSVMVYSSTFVRLDEETGDPTSAMRRQMIFAGVALVAYVAASMIDYRLYLRFPVLIYSLMMIALIVVLFAPPQ